MRIKKGQVWVQDTMVALLIIVATVIMFILNYSNIMVSNNDFDEIYDENRIISEYLMLEGTPNDWNESNVIRIGITNSDYSLNTTKLSLLYNISKDSYDTSRKYLGTKFDYIVFFRDYDGNLLNLTYGPFIGKEGINSTNLLEETTEVITKTDRYLIHKTSDGSTIYKDIIKMTVYSWK